MESSCLTLSLWHTQEVSRPLDANVLEGAARAPMLEVFLYVACPHVGMRRFPFTLRVGRGRHASCYRRSPVSFRGTEAGRVTQRTCCVPSFNSLPIASCLWAPRFYATELVHHGVDGVPGASWRLRWSHRVASLAPLR